MLKLIEPNTGPSTVVDEQNTEGLMEFRVNHEIKESKAFLTYTGPKIPPEEWHKVLAFFKWTYDTYHSESQVWMFVNPKENTWKLWAFPQEAKTGMNAREIPGEEFDKQRKELFGDSLDWVAFGTVHHHCNMSAFQSHTDEQNEKNQDGLHITIGNIDNALEYDIHARFYRKGHKFSPDMSLFWDIGDDLEIVPKKLRNKLGADAADVLARAYMCQPAPEGTEIPQQWKNNVIEVPKPVIIHQSATAPMVLGFTGPAVDKKQRNWSAKNAPMWQRKQSCLDDIIEEYKDSAGFDWAEEVVACLEIFDDRKTVEFMVLSAMKRHNIDVDDLLAEIQDRVKKEAAKALGNGSGVHSTALTDEEAEWYRGYHIPPMD